MKKGRNIMLLICALSFCLVMGIFVGRNLRDGFVELPASDPILQEALQTQPIDPRLDLNTATKTQLMELPGIGDVLAQRIIDYRAEVGAFHAIDDLLEVEGIGQTKLEQIQHLIRIGG